MRQVGLVHWLLLPCHLFTTRALRASSYFTLSFRSRWTGCNLQLSFLGNYIDEYELDVLFLLSIGIKAYTLWKETVLLESGQFFALLK